MSHKVITMQPAFNRSRFRIKPPIGGKFAHSLQGTYYEIPPCAIVNIYQHSM